MRDPLTHFLLMAGAILLFHHLLQQHAKPELKITREELDLAQRDFENRIRRSATAAERVRLAEEMVGNEVLAREAIATGLGNDNRVRGLLAKLMRTSLEPVLSDPDDAALLQIRAMYPDDYRLPMRVVFEHVGFSSPDRVPADFLATLRGSGPPAGVGESVGLSNPSPPTYLPQIERFVGMELADRLGKMPLTTWEGPFQTARGYLFVRVTQREAETEMPFDQIRAALVAKWRYEMIRREIATATKRLREKYRVILPDDVR
jgi:hypothetical protein